MYLSKLTFRYLLKILYVSLLFLLFFCLIHIYIYMCVCVCWASLHIYSIEQFCCNPYFCIAMVALFPYLHLAYANITNKNPWHTMRVCIKTNSLCVQCSAVQCSFLNVYVLISMCVQFHHHLLFSWQRTMLVGVFVYIWFSICLSYLQFILSILIFHYLRLEFLLHFFFSLTAKQTHLSIFNLLLSTRSSYSMCVVQFQNKRITRLFLFL